MPKEKSTKKGKKVVPLRKQGLLRPQEDEPFAGFGQLQATVVKATLLAPAWTEKCRIDERHSCGIRVRLGGYVYAMFARVRDNCQAGRRLAQTLAIDVCDMNRSATNHRGSDDLGYGLNTGPRLSPPRASCMDVNRYPMARREPENLDDFESGRAR